MNYVSTHSRLKAAGALAVCLLDAQGVSTHSRLKAAGYIQVRFEGSGKCFNTQPPEGGWIKRWPRLRNGACFNTQPPEGGWAAKERLGGVCVEFQHTAA